eukprot:GEMP01009212.1.p1 GENE.GEMP01009212.1~~GEMP01009212.1.p1  ORF type:complete len:1002 (+),score=278.11 GEMP01009212.1:418-3423(+)
MAPAVGKDELYVKKEGGSFLMGFNGKMLNRILTLTGASVEVFDCTELPPGVAAVSSTTSRFSRGSNGKGGSGMRERLPELHSRVQISGTEQQRRQGKKYVQFICQPNHGVIQQSTIEDMEDVTFVRVPPETVSFGNHSKQGFLRNVEDEWSILLFFVDESDKNDKKKVPTARTPNDTQIGTEQLALFGPQRHRHGGLLKIMATVESKRPGFFTSSLKERRSTKEGFDYDVMLIDEEDYSYALGKSGTTRRKLARASQCIVEYIGRAAFMAGDKEERSLARDYLAWLLEQRVGSVKVDYRSRSDVTVVMLPRPSIGFMTGVKGGSLRQIEDETGTFCFIEGAIRDDTEEKKPLLICGKLAKDRQNAHAMVTERLLTKMPDGYFLNNFEKGKGKKKMKGKGGMREQGKDVRDGKNGAAAEHGPPPLEFSLQEDIPLIRDKSERTTESMPMSEEHIAFFAGKAKRKLMQVELITGCTLEAKGDHFEIFGVKEDIPCAKTYMNVLIQLHAGPATLNETEHKDDMTIIDVPCDTIGFVSGKQESFLRLIEEEFHAILFFIVEKKAGEDEKPDKGGKRDMASEKLAIIGRQRCRRGAELKIMAAIETKKHGYFTTGKGNNVSPDPFGTDTMVIDDEDYSYALGKGGATRKKIARASKCIIEYIGRLAFLSGTKLQRQRAREYLQWLFQQRIGSVEVKYTGRDDVTVIHVPKECVGYVTGHKGTSLRSVEDITGTFCFIEGGREDERDPKPLLICGVVNEARKKAEEIIRGRIEQKLAKGWVPYDPREDDRLLRQRYSSGPNGWYSDGNDWYGSGAYQNQNTDDWIANQTKEDAQVDAKKEEIVVPEEDAEEGWGNWGDSDCSDVEPEATVSTAVGGAPSVGGGGTNINSTIVNSGTNSSAASMPNGTKRSDSGALSSKVERQSSRGDASSSSIGWNNNNNGSWGGGSNAGWSPGGWNHNHLRSQSAKNTPLKAGAQAVEDEPLPPQLLHEEAWPELGQKVPKRRGKR